LIGSNIARSASARLRFLPLVRHAAVHQFRPPLFQRDIRRQLRLADLPLLLFDGNLRVQFVLLDLAFQFHRRIAPRVDRFIRLLQQFFASVSAN